MLMTAMITLILPSTLAKNVQVVPKPPVVTTEFTLSLHQELSLVAQRLPPKFLLLVEVEEAVAETEDGK